MLRGLSLCALAGAALALCLPKPGLCFLAWLAPAVLFRALLDAKGARRSAGLATAFGAAYCGTALHWIYLTCRFAGVPVPVAVLAWAGLTLLLSLNWALYGALASRVKGPWALAALWAALEFASARWTPRVAPDLLEYTQWRRLSMIQGAAWAGPHALGFLVMLWGAAAARLPKQRRGAALAGALVLAWWAQGAWVLAGRRPEPGGPCVEILQPNIDQYRKWDGDYASDIRAVLDGLLKRTRLEAPDLVLWPESALPGWLDEGGLAAWVSGWARRLKAPMLVGALTRPGGAARNSAVLFGPDGVPQGAYHKRRLVPFGEFVPLRSWLEGSIGILAQMGDFEAGPARQDLLGPWPLAVSVCYEAVFPDLVRGDASRGARILANLTNDGWYKDTWGPYQHFRANVFRAVENRAFVLRAANTGVSAVIDPYGKVLGRTGLGAAVRLDACLSADPFPRGSFYARAGDWFGWLCLLLSAASLAFGTIKRWPTRDSARPKRR